MEVKSANAMLQLNRATTAVENNGSENSERQQMTKSATVENEENISTEEDSVKISISAAGLQKSRYLEYQENDISESDVSELLKKIDGLSSQVINGHFSSTDRLNFQIEISRLMNEWNRLNGDGISFSKYDNLQLSQQINDLTRMINDAAVYRRSAKTLFVVKNQPKAGMSRTTLDIAI